MGREIYGDGYYERRHCGEGHWGKGNIMGNRIMERDVLGKGFSCGNGSVNGVSPKVLGVG